MPSALRPAFEQFSGQPADLREALHGADGGQLGRMVTGSDWTVRDEIHHLAESEQLFAIRARLIIAEDDPMLPARDAAAWKRRLQYIWRDIDSAIALFELTRWGNAELLEHLRGEHWERTGVLGEQRLTLAELLRTAVEATAEAIERVAETRAR